VFEEQHKTIFMALAFRSSVCISQTSEGVLFRSGDAYLPVRGKGIPALLQVLTSAMTASDGCVDGLELSPRHQEVVSSLIKALIEADMIYTTPAIENLDDQDAHPDVVSLVGRFATRSQSPLSALAKVRCTRILLLGNRNLRNYLMVAAKESHFFLTDSILESTILMDTKAHQTLAAEIANIDIVVVAGILGLDDDLFDLTVRLRSDFPGTPFVPFLQTSEFFLTGAPTGSCIRCLLLAYGSSRTAFKPTSPLSTLATFSASLLFQSLQDTIADIVPLKERHLVHELDVHTLHTRTCPVPPSPLCNFCSPFHISFSACDWLARVKRTPVIDPDLLVEAVTTHLVDERVGIILKLDEGDLLQLPHHQSAALWHTPSLSKDRFWTTDTGADFVSARAHVLRRTLEQYIQRCHSVLRPERVYCAYDPISERISESAFHSHNINFVFSNSRYEDFIVDGLFLSLAHLASQTDEWQPVSFPNALESDITFLYLADVHALERVEVQQWMMCSGLNCQVLRFIHDGVPISVTAGLGGLRPWVIGLKDVWLFRTSSAIVSHNCPSFPTLRLRSAGGDQTLVLTLIRNLAGILGLSFELIPLPFGVDSALGALEFATARLKPNIDQHLV